MLGDQSHANATQFWECHGFLESQPILPDLMLTDVSLGLWASPTPGKVTEKDATMQKTRMGNGKQS